MTYDICFASLSNIVKPDKNGCHLANVIFKCIFVKENYWILIRISAEIVHGVPIGNRSVLVEEMAWCCRVEVTKHCLVHS